MVLPGKQASTLSASHILHDALKSSSFGMNAEMLWVQILHACIF